jgi:hypothetical protein
VDFSKLYGEARKVSQDATRFLQDLAAERDMDIANRAIKAVESLEKDIFENLEKNVLGAAAAGLREATILEFGGGDIRDGFSLVFLVRGPRLRERREELAMFGFDPLMITLPGKLAPFRLRHVWHEEMHSNELVVSW